MGKGQGAPRQSAQPAYTGLLGTPDRWRARGELVQQAGDRVGAGHGQLQGKDMPSPGIHAAGT
jgi:hypothetical protein